MNQTLKQYLRYFYDYQQTNWVRLLPIKIIAYNTSEYSTTKRTLFFINKGFKANIFLEIKECEELILYIIVIVEEIYKL